MRELHGGKFSDNAPIYRGQIRLTRVRKHAEDRVGTAPDEQFTQLEGDD